MTKLKKHGTRAKSKVDFRTLVVLIKKGFTILQVVFLALVNFLREILNQD